MSGIVERLRVYAGGTYPITQEAADEIERLRGLLLEWILADERFDMEAWVSKVRDAVEEDQP